MSFNFLEIAHVAQLIEPCLPDEVVGAELVRFPSRVGASSGLGLADLNVAIKLKNSRRSIVFSLKQPWTGMFFLPTPFWTQAGNGRQKPVWSTAFNGCEGPAQDWNSYIQGQRLTSIEVAKGDRIVTLRFSNDAILKIELFPARPNWVLSAGGIDFSWRTSLPLRAPGASVAALREFAEPTEPTDLNKSWMQRVYEYYLKLRQAAVLQAERQRVLSHLQTRMTRLLKIRGQMEESLRESAKADSIKEHAEILKSRLHEFKPGQKAGRVDEIMLDPKYTIAENVSQLFARYKKLQRTKREVEARLLGIEDENKKITGSLTRVRNFKGDYPEFMKLVQAESLDLGQEAEVGKERKGDKRWRESVQKLGIRQFKTKDGLQAWVGRNHKENEELVIRLARGNDLWMHLKGRPGAHVIIQMPGGKSPSLETLLDGAVLVAYYSGVSNKEKVEVDYTFRKFVKRVPGGGDKFLVTYTQNKTLMIKMEDERLWRLLKQH